MIRTFRPEIADAPPFVRDFEATAVRIASLDHPAIVTIHDYWREPGAAYVVMGRMHGGTLADRLARGSMTRHAVDAVVQRIGGALLAAHQAGLVHGRVTARNVLFDGNDAPFITDFALGQPDRNGTAADDVRDFTALVATAGFQLGLAQSESPTLADLLTSPPAAPGNPYKGLRPFDEADAADFFGRDDVVDEMLARLGRDDLAGRLVLLVAGSGTGKSSVVRAGLLPRIRRGAAPGSASWFVTTMVPGAKPFEELAESLRRVLDHRPQPSRRARVRHWWHRQADPGTPPEDAQLLLVIDQFEELFTLAGERDQRAFIDGLMDALGAEDSRLRVVATLRADFFDRPLAFHRLGTMLSDSTVTIASMTPAQLEAAIVEPAARAGRGVEGALVAELVSAVIDQPAALPSLQFALYELPTRCDGDLTLAAYSELGGVQGAIAVPSGGPYSSLDDPERESIRALFEQLVVINADGEPTRRRAKRSELVGASLHCSMPGRTPGC